MKVGYQILADLQQQQAFKQWGFTVFDPVYYKNVNFTLPLSVNGTFCAFSTGYDAKVSTFLWHSMSHFNNVNVGVTGFVFDSRYTFTGLGYLAICWQKQWGINTGGAVRTSTLPIPFTNVFLAVASTSSEWCCPGCSATNTTVTTRAYQSNRPDVAQPNDVNWIIIGCQPQWGNSWSGYTGVFNWYFPISPSQVYAACLTKHTKNISSSHNWEPARVEEWNNSYARIHPDGDLGYSVIAICKAQQQWGYCSSRTATFPIPFPTAALFIVAVPKTTSTSATATGAEYLGTTSVNLYLHGTSGWYFVGGH